MHEVGRRSQSTNVFRGVWRYQQASWAYYVSHEINRFREKSTFLQFAGNARIFQYFQYLLYKIDVLFSWLLEKEDVVQV